MCCAVFPTICGALRLRAVLPYQVEMQPVRVLSMQRSKRIEDDEEEKNGAPCTKASARGPGERNEARSPDDNSPSIRVCRMVMACKPGAARGRASPRPHRLQTRGGGGSARRDERLLMYPEEMRSYPC
ncbi:unnamed protein product [Lota lota]